MTIKDTLELSLKNIKVRKLRSLLTTLGIIFGIASVISMVAIGEGARRQTLRQIELLGINNIRIKSVKPVIKEKKENEKQTWVGFYGVKIKDMEHIKKLIDGLEHIIPLKDLRENVWSGTRKTDLKVFATIPDYMQTVGLELEDGRFITESDLNENKLVCVLGQGAKKKLFKNEDIKGAFIKVRNRYLQIVGVLKDKSSAKIGSIESGDINNYIFIPFTTSMNRFGKLTYKRESGSSESVKVEVDELIVNVSDVNRVMTVSKTIDNYLKKSHEKEDCEIVVPLELLKQREESQRIFNVVMISIAAISLLVGGIGIMNIMLANVIERTKEIGTRRALGATKGDIVQQFVIESIVLACIGGFLGILLGVGGAAAVSLIAKYEIYIEPASIAVAFIISTFVGVVFGIYPAYKAAKLDPIQALKTE